MSGTLLRLFSFFVGFVYPTYASLKALESKNTDDDTQWLTYWVLYSFALIMETFADFFVFWVPFYRILKCVGVYWLVSPKFKGSAYMYKLMAPHLKMAMPTVDKVVGDVMKGDFTGVKNEVVPRVTESYQYVAKHAPEMWEKTMSMAADAMKKGEKKAD